MYWVKLKDIEHTGCSSCPHQVDKYSPVSTSYSLSFPAHWARDEEVRGSLVGWPYTWKAKIQGDQQCPLTNSGFAVVYI